MKASKFTYQANFVHKQLFDKLSAFSENVCHILSDLKRSKSKGKSKWNELLQLATSTETIQMLEEVQDRLFDDENEQFINLKFIAPEDIENDKIRICEILQSIEKDFYLDLSQKAFTSCKEIHRKIEAHLNLLKNGTKTVNEILLWICTQIIEILKQKIFTKWSKPVESNLKELNFVDKKSSLEQTINHVKIDVKSVVKKRALKNRKSITKTVQTNHIKQKQYFQCNRYSKIRGFVESVGLIMTFYCHTFQLYFFSYYF